MNSQAIEQTTAVISYVEAHLTERLRLDDIAGAVCYSKYHLHRMFTGTAGIPLHDYIQRRRLTEAARRLVFSTEPILEIALSAGYESQRAFASVFRAMYKKTPLEYRKSGKFYPLQLALSLQKNPCPPEDVPGNIVYAASSDLPDWMDFLPLVADGFPGLEQASHMEQARRYIEKRQALILRDGPAIIGAAAFSGGNGSVDFLAVHPQYRRRGIGSAFLKFLTRREFAGRSVSITTFREGDRAGSGQRAAYQKMGFVESELLTEFGYPTQRLILPPGKGPRYE